MDDSMPVYQGTNSVCSNVIPVLLSICLFFVLSACSTTGTDHEDAGASSADAIAYEEAIDQPGVQAFEAGEYERARELLEQEAAKGNPIAARYLGQLYREGLDTEQDTGKAGQAFHRGAVLGDTESQVYLARLFYDGLDFDQDLHRAAYWFRQAAEHENAEAQYALYNILLQGLTGDIRAVSALGWAYHAAQSGYQGGEQAWSNRSMLVSPRALEAILEKAQRGEWPRYPETDNNRRERLRAVPDDSASATSGNEKPSTSLRLRFPDGKEIRIRGVEEMDNTMPVDGVTNPWISYRVVDVTEMIKHVRGQFGERVDIIEARVRTEIERDGEQKLRMTTRLFRREE